MLNGDASSRQSLQDICPKELRLGRSFQYFGELLHLSNEFQRLLELVMPQRQPPLLNEGDDESAKHIKQCNINLPDLRPIYSRILEYIEVLSNNNKNTTKEDVKSLVQTLPPSSSSVLENGMFEIDSVKEVEDLNNCIQTNNEEIVREMIKKEWEENGTHVLMPPERFADAYVTSQMQFYSNTPKTEAYPINLINEFTAEMTMGGIDNLMYLNALDCINKPLTPDSLRDALKVNENQLSKMKLFSSWLNIGGKNQLHMDALSALISESMLLHEEFLWLNGFDDILLEMKSEIFKALLTMQEKNLEKEKNAVDEDLGELPASSLSDDEAVNEEDTRAHEDTLAEQAISKINLRQTLRAFLQSSLEMKRSTSDGKDTSSSLEKLTTLLTNLITKSRRLFQLFQSNKKDVSVVVKPLLAYIVLQKDLDWKELESGNLLADTSLEAIVRDLPVSPAAASTSENEISPGSTLETATMKAMDSPSTMRRRTGRNTSDSKGDGRAIDYSSPNVTNLVDTKKLINNVIAAADPGESPSKDGKQADSEQASIAEEKPSSGGASRRASRPSGYLTPFILFQREKIKEFSRQGIDFNGRLQERANHISKAWHKVSPEENLYWGMKASKMNEEAGFTVVKKKLASRGHTGFTVFSKERRADCKAKNIYMGSNLAEQNAFVARLWKAISPEERKAYQEKSKKMNIAREEKLNEMNMKEQQMIEESEKLRMREAAASEEGMTPSQDSQIKRRKTESRGNSRMNGGSHTSSNQSSGYWGNSSETEYGIAETGNKMQRTPMDERHPSDEGGPTSTSTMGSDAVYSDPMLESSTPHTIQHSTDVLFPYTSGSSSRLFHQSMYHRSTPPNIITSSDDGDDEESTFYNMNDELLNNNTSSTRYFCKEQMHGMETIDGDDVCINNKENTHDIIETTVSTASTHKRSRKLRVTKRNKRNENNKHIQGVPASETVWSIVKRNKRLVTKEERSKKKELMDKQHSMKSDEASVLQLLSSSNLITTQQDPLLSLFSEPSTASNQNESKSISLFDRPTQISGPSVKVDTQGNFIIEEDGDRDVANTPSVNSLHSLLEGRHVINENMAKSQVPAYEGAYKKQKTKKWTDSDTLRFYKAIEMFGTDLMMVQVTMPEFNHKQIRTKFKAEERRQQFKLEAALRQHSNIEVPEYEQYYEALKHQIEDGEIDIEEAVSNDVAVENDGDENRSAVDAETSDDNKCEVPAVSESLKTNGLFDLLSMITPPTKEVGVMEVNTCTNTQPFKDVRITESSSHAFDILSLFT